MFKKVTPVISSVIGVSLLLTACSSPDNPATAKGKSEAKQSIHLPYIAEIPTMNVMRSVFEGFYTLGDGNKTIPGVAESCDINSDKKTYTFHLKDTKWSNGTPVTVAEYEFLFFDIKNAKKINSKELPVDQLGVKAIDKKH